MNSTFVDEIDVNFSRRKYEGSTMVDLPKDYKETFIDTAPNDGPYSSTPLRLDPVSTEKQETPGDKSGHHRRRHRRRTSPPVALGEPGKRRRHRRHSPHTQRPKHSDDSEHRVRSRSSPAAGMASSTFEEDLKMLSRQTELMHDIDAATSASVEADKVRDRIPRRNLKQEFEKSRDVTGDTNQADYQKTPLSPKYARDSIPFLHDSLERIDRLTDGSGNRDKERIKKHDNKERIKKHDASAIGARLLRPDQSVRDFQQKAANEPLVVSSPTLSGISHRRTVGDCYRLEAKMAATSKKPNQRTLRPVSPPTLGVHKVLISSPPYERTHSPPNLGEVFDPHRKQPNWSTNAAEVALLSGFTDFPPPPPTTEMTSFSRSPLLPIKVLHINGCLDDSVV